MYFFTKLFRVQHRVTQSSTQCITGFYFTQWNSVLYPVRLCVNSNFTELLRVLHRVTQRTTQCITGFYFTPWNSAIYPMRLCVNSNFTELLRVLHSVSQGSYTPCFTLCDSVLTAVSQSFSEFNTELLR